MGNNFISIPVFSGTNPAHVSLYAKANFAEIVIDPRQASAARERQRKWMQQRDAYADYDSQHAPTMGEILAPKDN